MSDTVIYIEKYLDINGVGCTAAQSGKLAEYVDALLEENRVMNLTAVKTAQQAALLHIADCAKILPYLRPGSLIDVGTGAGLPAFVVAVFRPDISVTALDSTGKKCEFIARTAARLGLSNISVLCGRAEELALRPEYRERFDVSSARAVAELRVLCELCLPFVKKGGVFVAMKGPKGEEEAQKARNAVEKLGGKVSAVDSFSLAGEDDLKRTVIRVDKTGPVPPRYPRRFSQILRCPL